MQINAISDSLSSPKAKVSRSNRVGCAKFRPSPFGMSHYYRRATFSKRADYGLLAPIEECSRNVAAHSSLAVSIGAIFRLAHQAASLP
jgi:hypothetical protein